MQTRDEELTLPASPSSVVIVDDMPDNLRLLFGILSEQGYRVRVLPNGEMALTAIRREPPDIVLLDIMMPDMDGYEVCAALKASEQTRSIPVIFLSALDEVTDKVKAFEVGGVDYITKPFRAEEVLARVSIHLSVLHMQRQLQQQNEQLAHSVNELERRNLEMLLLSRMSTFLQRADNWHEAIDLCLPFLRQLFAQAPGALYLVNPTSNVLEKAAEWGNDVPCEMYITMEHCPVFTGTRVNLVESADDDELCTHCKLTRSFPYICVQLVTRREPLGLLHLQHSAQYTEEDLEHWQQMAVMVADHLALGLSNLQLREQLHERAIRDPLTGLFNRYYLDDTLQRELSRATRKSYGVGFIMIDIDHFKRYNDTYGHDGGDVLLRAFGAFLKRSVRREDIACRFGGEEFLLVLPGSNLAETYERAASLCEAARTLRIQHAGQPLGSITVSVGVANFPEHATNAARLIAAADHALYRAKSTGRDQVVTAETA